MKLPSSSATELHKPELKHFLKTQDFTRQELTDILELMGTLKEARKANAVPQLFAGKSVAMIFEQPSTRTRVSFETAATILGGHGLFLSPKDIHLGAKESLADTGRVLSRMCDVIMARVDDHKTVAGLAEYSTVPVINGLCDWLHPTQIMADLFTMMEHLPEGRKLEDLTVGFCRRRDQRLLFLDVCLHQVRHALQTHRSPEVPGAPDVAGYRQRKHQDLRRPPDRD